MIERLHRIALAIRTLTLPLWVVGAVCLFTAVYLVLNAASHSDNRLLIPAMLGFLWAITAIAFIHSFLQVPAKAAATDRLLARWRRALSRFWQWVIGLLFLGVSLALLIFSIRLIRIWYKDYGA